MQNPSALLLLSSGASIGFRFISNIVLAHLLLPFDFGLIAMATVLMTAMSMLSDTGAGISIARKQRKYEAQWLEQLWTLQILRGSVLWCAAWLAAPWAASLYDAQELKVILPAIGASLAIDGLRWLRPRVLTYEMLPALELKVSLTAQIAGSLVAILSALASPTVWSLVAGVITTSCIGTILSFAWSGERPPRPILTPGFLKDQWRMARWIGVSSGIGFFASQADRALFPALFSTAAFGVYSTAGLIAMIPLQIGQKWADGVYLPWIATASAPGAKRDHKDLRLLRRKVAVFAALATAVPTGLGNPLFSALYPPAFMKAGLFVSILSVAAYTTLLTYIHRRQFLYHGMMQFEVLIEASRFLLFAAAIGLAITLGQVDWTEYALLYAVSQFAVYFCVVILGRLRGLIGIRDDLPGHLTFVGVSLLLVSVDQVIRSSLGAFASLVITAALSAAVAGVLVLIVGLPGRVSRLARPTNQPD
ncbi:oligosaccharide flippase family protein [Sphingomonas lutea]|uniref:Oligosaccharide flippase family protein n=1 Tax=Sphingomonas lutea TaxID=1045317 RepID=A0A7G9SH04_9SPHN|nr:oligosaccharide flippase family protein [Sphingomonas lutea]QNN67129.1 oligosaccharide flippase family protein [Sphingomonas lutea]